MLSRKEIISDLVSFKLQEASKDWLDGNIDIQTFQGALDENTRKARSGAGYTHPAAAAYLMEHAFTKIDQGDSAVKDRLEVALSYIIKSARLSGNVLGMMMDMHISGMRGMESDSIPLKEYAPRSGYKPLENVSVLENDYPEKILYEDGKAPGKMQSWQTSIAKSMDSWMPDLMEGRLSLADFKRQATCTTGDTADGYADVLFLTMSKGFEYFAANIEQNSPELPKKLGIFKAAISSIISAADTDAKQKAAMDDIAQNGIPCEINEAAYHADITLSIQAGYEGCRRPEKLKAMFATATAIPLYGKETDKIVTPIEYAKMVINDPKATLAQVARDVVSVLKQHNLSQAID